MSGEKQPYGGGKQRLEVNGKHVFPHGSLKVSSPLLGCVRQCSVDGALLRFKKKQKTRVAENVLKVFF